MSQLTNGKIPAHTECPFKDMCEFNLGGVCRHTGKNHDCEFSCASARGFDLILNSPREKFRAEYTKQLTKRVKENPKEFIFGEGEIPKIVKIQMDSILNGRFNLNSKSVKETFDALGIEHNYASLNAYFYGLK